MSRVNVRIQGHYEVNDLSYGWQGLRVDADAHHTICPSCGTDHTVVLREVVGRHLGEQVLHPWHPDYEDWGRFKEDGTESQEWLELQFLDEDWRKNAREARKE